MSRWLVVLLLVVGAAGAAVYLLREKEEEDAGTIELDVDASVDAAVDARAPAKGKPAKKRPAARGGKTHVAGHGAGHGAPPKRPAERNGKAAAPAGPSYESALDGNDEQITMGSKSADLTDAQLSAPMSDGAFLGECDTPDSTSVTVKVAIRNGRAVGVTVDTTPASASIATCIDRHVRTLSWPASPKLDSLVTTY